MLPCQPTRIELKHEDSKELLPHRARHQEKQRASHVTQTQSQHQVIPVSTLQPSSSSVAARIGATSSVPAPSSHFEQILSSSTTTSSSSSWR